MGHFIMNFPKEVLHTTTSNLICTKTHVSHDAWFLKVSNDILFANEILQTKGER